MKKIFSAFLLCVLCQYGYSQNLKILKSEEGSNVNYTKQEQLIWSKALDQYSKINSGALEYNSISEEDKKFIDSLESGFGPLTQGPGCSWYCGGGPYKITASSYLKEQDQVSYNPNNIHDFDLFNAWVPNTKEGIIGSKVNFHLKPFSPRITKIIIYNGYLKNSDLWKANSRAKKLKLYINNKPVALLELNDEPGSQIFTIDPVQSKDKTKDLILTLEVVEIYRGSKYDDMAISEVNFDGLDVHCFNGKTMITMADNTFKQIQDLKPGDKILSFNAFNNTYFADEVTELITSRHKNLYELNFENISIVSTDDHPFYIKAKGWCAVNPEKYLQNYIPDINVTQIKIGDSVLTYLNQVSNLKKLTGLNSIKDEQLTYTILIKKGNSFIANGLIVKTELLPLIK